MSTTKIALVTGANRGIGFAIAQELGARGVMVLLGSRNEARGKQAAESLAAQGLSVAPLEIDVTDATSIANAAAEVECRYDRLDILVNNAAIAGSSQGPPSEVTLEQLREVYDTNVFGVVAVTNAILPLLRRSPAGRIVNMSSHVASFTISTNRESPFWQYNAVAYQSSKTALNAITLAYAKELQETGIKVNAANPGYTATDLNNYRGNRTVAEGAAVAVRLAMLGPDGPTGTSQDDDGTVAW